MRLAAGINAYYISLPIDQLVVAVIAVFERLTGKRPMYESQGGTPREDIALQNIQARMSCVVCLCLCCMSMLFDVPHAGTQAAHQASHVAHFVTLIVNRPSSQSLVSISYVIPRLCPRP